MNNLIKNKIGLVMGLASSKSIAWGISKVCSDQGARLVISYQNENLKKRIETLAHEVEAESIIECDVSNDKSVDEMFNYIKNKWGKLDFLVHAIAFSDKNELQGQYIDTSRSNFLKTLDISCYSFLSVAKKASQIMTSGGSILTLSYYGAEKVISNYNVMGVAKAALESSVRYIAADLGTLGIRVNAISAGPIKTLAASGIKDFRSMLKFSHENSPLKKNVNIFDIGNTAAFLISELSQCITGEIIYVDSGYHIIGSPKKFVLEY